MGRLQVNHFLSNITEEQRGVYEQWMNIEEPLSENDKVKKVAGMDEFFISLMLSLYYCFK